MGPGDTSSGLSLQGVVYGQHPERQYYGLTWERGLCHEAVANWETDESIDTLLSLDLGTVIWETWQKKSHEALLDIDGALLHVQCSGSGQVSARVAAEDLELARRLLRTVREALPKPRKSADGKISVRFWHDSENGPKSSRRRLDAPRWDAIRANYPARTGRYLESLMDGFRPAHGGQVLLWHGPPGTGKTFALRALCREWEDWATFEYVLDPERLFGASAAYLLNFLLGTGDDDEPSESKPADGKAGRWRLIILEDTGELVSEDAKERAGQGLSRLLNVTDGFVGQGLRVLVLITTNERLERLHPAISRPGRASSVVLFDAFSSDDGNAWLRAHGAAATDLTRPTLADLYARVEEFAARPTKQSSIGFSTLLKDAS